MYFCNTNCVVWGRPASSSLHLNKDELIDSPFPRSDFATAISLFSSLCIVPLSNAERIKLGAIVRIILFWHIVCGAVYVETGSSGLEMDGGTREGYCRGEKQKTNSR